MPEQIYGAARAFAVDLTAHGQPTAAARLVEAIEAGSTSGEILMRLRWELSQLDAEALPSSLAAQLQSLIGALNEVLE